MIERKKQLVKKQIKQDRKQKNKGYGKAERVQE
jgi:hypothetical protein